MRLRAVKYRRISDDREGEELGVLRQNEDLDVFADQRGYVIVDDYVDDDIGASTRSRKDRPDFKRMLADAKAGKFDVIIAYTSGRVTRRPRENEDLIDLAEKQGIRFDYIRSPAFDLNTADGRHVARIMAAGDAAEVERTAERVARAALQRARQGKPTGGIRPFGWESRGGAIVPHEAAMIREAADHVLTGGYLAQIVDRWNAAGQLSAQGKQWKRTSLRGVLTSPRLAGLVTYRGEVLSGVEAVWEPILDVETWRAVSRRLLENTRPQPYRSFLLSGVLRCTCGALMYGNGRGTTRAGHYYRCSKEWGGCGQRAVSGEGVDRLISTLVERRLGELQVDLPVVEFEGQANLKHAIEQRDELLAAYKANVLPGSIAFPQIAEREEEISRLQRERAAIGKEALPPAGARLLWQSGDLAQQRDVVRRLYSAILVHPSKAGTRSGPKFDPDRIEPFRRGSETRQPTPRP